MGKLTMNSPFTISRMKEYNWLEEVFTFWITIIEMRGKSFRFDLNKISEDITKCLLNKIYGYNLSNVNSKRGNHIAIDLEDVDRKIAFQVTSRRDCKKIRETLKKFKKKCNGNVGKLIYFLILGKDKPKLNDKQKQEFKNIYHNFNPDKHILTLFDLKSDIERIYDENFEKYNEIKKIIEKEFVNLKRNRNILKNEFLTKLNDPVGEISKKNFHAFISYNSNDYDDVNKIVQWLVDNANLNFWFDKKDIDPIDHWLKEMEEALDKSDCFVIFLGSKGLGKWQEEEMYIALNKKISEESIRIIPVLITDKRNTIQDINVPLFLKSFRPVIFQESWEDIDALQGLVLNIAGSMAKIKIPKIGPEICPYRGLKVFREQDQKFFFGREEAVKEMNSKLKNEHFLVVQGSSGCGKSSLVQAGLIPFLREKEKARIVLFSPRVEPVEELAIALHRCFPNERTPMTRQLVERLMDENRNIYHIVKEILDDSDENNLIIVIDQFEEIFARAINEDKRKQFVQFVLDSIKDSLRPVKVILIIRSDFIDKCAVYPKFYKYLKDTLLFFEVDQMTQKELRRVIEEPARMVQVEFVEGLTNRILEDVKGAPGELPLLQHGLFELYKEREYNQITLKSYNKVGGIQGALVKRAESEFNNLKNWHKDILRKLFVLRLVEPGEGTEDTRRRATKEEILATNGNPQISEYLLNLWTKSGLLTISWDSFRNEHYIDVTHEALIRKWIRIQTWMEKDREVSRQFGYLRRALMDWIDNNKQDNYLPRGPQLVQLESLLTIHEIDMTKNEKEFINAGIDLRLKEEKQKEEEHQRKIRQNRTRTRIGVIIGIILVVITVFAYIQKKRADIQYIEAKSNGIAAESFLVLSKDNLKAIRIAEASYKIKQINPTPYAQRALSAAAYSAYERPFYSAIMKHKNKITTFALSPDGTKIVTASIDGTASLWDYRGNGLIDLNRHAQAVNSIVFSPDGTKILTASDDNTAKLFDLSGNLIADLDRHTAQVTDALFSPKGDNILTISRDKTAKLWDLKGNLLADLNKHTAQISNALFSTKGDKILTVSWDNTAKLWDLNGALMADLNGHKDYISIAVFSPDGLKIATASWDRTAKMWDLKGNIQCNVNHDDYIWSVAFSPNGSKILTASSDQTATLWDLSGKFLKEYKHNDKVWNAVFSSDGEKILTRTGKSVKLWSFQGKLLVDLNHDFEVKDTFFTPDGSKILTRTANSVKLWDLQGKLLLNLNNFDAEVTHAIISPDENNILVSSGKSVKRWDLKNSFVSDLNKYTQPLNSALLSPNGSMVLTITGNSAKLWESSGKFETELKGHTAIILSAAFSSDGKWIVTGSWDNYAKLWDLEGNLHLDKRLEAQVVNVSFSSDGSKILTVTYDYRVNLWDLKGNSITELNKNVDDITGAVLSPDGEKVLTTSESNSARLFDLNSRLLAELKHTDKVLSALFSPDGKRILTTSRDKTAKLWDLNGNLLADMKNHTEAVAGAVFSHDGSRILTFSDDDTAKLWDLKGNLLADLNKHTDDILSAAFSPGDDRIITVSKDGTVKRWFTPEAIIQWLKNAPIPKLTEEDKEKLQITNFDID